MAFRARFAGGCIARAVVVAFVARGVVVAFVARIIVARIVIARAVAAWDIAADSAVFVFVLCIVVDAVGTAGKSECGDSGQAQ